MNQKSFNVIEQFYEIFTSIPTSFLQNINHRFDSLQYELSIRQDNSLKIPFDALKKIKRQLLILLESDFTSSNDLTHQNLDINEQKLLNYIRRETERMNSNNITRTEAYRQIFFKYPNLHWAFLAHMVSRNGGWNMTDLKGDIFPHILDAKEIQEFFNFLERCNALIFHDAYPQLLLYDESVKLGKNLFYLLPALNVSKFMIPFWNDFWTRKDPVLLTIALIINEQNYIEKRVVQKHTFKTRVFSNFHFKGQAIFQLTQIVFPFYIQRQAASCILHPRLAGLTLEDFTNLDERIKVGKTLYSILFGIDDVKKGAIRFAIEVPHTGSREDFWNKIFSSADIPISKQYFKKRLKVNYLKKNAPKFYSPALESVWENQTFEKPDAFDWFRNPSPFRYLNSLRRPVFFDMTNSFYSRLNRMELAALTLEFFKSFKS